MEKIISISLRIVINIIITIIHRVIYSQNIKKYKQYCEKNVFLTFMIPFLLGGRHQH